MILLESKMRKELESECVLFSFLTIKVSAVREQQLNKKTSLATGLSPQFDRFHPTENLCFPLYFYTHEASYSSHFKKI